MAFDKGRRVVFVSLEMTAQELVERALCQTSRKTQAQLQSIRASGEMAALMTPFLATGQASRFKIEDQRGGTIEDLSILLEETKRAFLWQVLEQQPHQLQLQRSDPGNLQQEHIA